MSLQPTFTKLRTGAWGIRVHLSETTIFPGANVHVTRKDGKVSRVIVKAIVWTDDKIALCSIVSPDKRADTSPRVITGRVHGGARCSGCAEVGGRCDECRAMDAEAYYR